jgi:hypothetical protein
MVAAADTTVVSHIIVVAVVAFESLGRRRHRKSRLPVNILHRTSLALKIGACAQSSRASCRFVLFIQLRYTAAAILRDDSGTIHGGSRVDGSKHDPARTIVIGMNTVTTVTTNHTPT